MMAEPRDTAEAAYGLLRGCWKLHVSTAQVADHASAWSSTQSSRSNGHTQASTDMHSAARQVSIVLAAAAAPTLTVPCRHTEGFYMS
jgi:hypothetical protein